MHLAALCAFLKCKINKKIVETQEQFRRDFQKYKNVNYTQLLNRFQKRKQKLDDLQKEKDFSSLKLTELFCAVTLSLLFLHQFCRLAGISSIGRRNSSRRGGSRSSIRGGISSSHLGRFGIQGKSGNSGEQLEWRDIENHATGDAADRLNQLSTFSKDRQ